MFFLFKILSKFSWLLFTQGVKYTPTYSKISNLKLPVVVIGLKLV